MRRWGVIIGAGLAAAFLVFWAINAVQALRHIWGACG